MPERRRGFLHSPLSVTSVESRPGILLRSCEILIILPIRLGRARLHIPQVAQCPTLPRGTSLARTRPGTTITNSTKEDGVDRRAQRRLWADSHITCRRRRSTPPLTLAAPSTKQASTPPCPPTPAPPATPPPTAPLTPSPPRTPATGPPSSPAAIMPLHAPPPRGDSPPSNPPRPCPPYLGITSRARATTASSTNCFWN